MHNLGRIGDFTVQMTNHALQRMCEMGMTAEMARDIVLVPDEKTCSQRRPGIVYYRKGNYTFPTAIKHGVLVVMTALYATQEAWDEAYEMGLIPEDRPVDKFRGSPTLRN